jgi:hypothetical protein
MESGFDPLKVKARENPACVAVGGELPSLTIPFLKATLSILYYQYKLFQNSHIKI